LAEVKIPETLWQDFVAVAKRQRHQPEALAQEVLQEYLQRIADEDLLADSERAARRARFPIEKTEEIIRQYRRKRKS
jgi:hypothetical protein